MKERVLLLKVVIGLAIGFTAACSGVGGQTKLNVNLPATPLAEPTETPQQNELAQQEAQLWSPIRQVDFGNFTFSRLPTGKCSMKTIQLINGRYDAPEDRVPRRVPSVDCWSVALAPIYYGDVTGDDEEDAIVELYAELGGNSSYSDVYIYTISNGHPVLLWKFMTGDRADGGVRRILAENGELVIELYGSGTRIGHLESSDKVGLCCPEHFTRTKYKWDGKQFHQDGEEQVLPNPSRAMEIVKP